MIFYIIDHNSDVCILAGYKTVVYPKNIDLLFPKYKNRNKVCKNPISLLGVCDNND